MSDIQTETNTVEIPGAADAGAAEQLQEAVNSTGEATVQEGQEHTSSEPKAETPAWVQRRFNEMTHAKHEAERKAAEAEQRAVTAERLAQAMQSTDRAAQPQQASTTNQANYEQHVQQEARRLNSEQQFNQRSNEVYGQGTAEFPDFDAALKNLGMLGASPDFFRDVVSLDDSHKVLHALGSNPEEAERILALPPLQQGRALEKLASKPIKQATTKPVSNAPPPISTVDGTSGATAIDLDRASIDDFMKARNSQSRKR